jgi:hypothetical protein
MKKYYDITAEGTNLVWFFYIGLAALILTVISWIYFMIKGKSLRSKLRMGLFILISFIWTMVIWISSMRHYLDANEALETGAISEVSGIVEDFSPIPPGDHGKESFSVKGVHFEFSPAEINYGFDQPVSHGGPAFEGRYVKIEYFEGRILRLWAKEE